MTVATSSVVTTYSGNGATTAFATGFAYLNDSDVVVTLVSALGVETVQTLTTHYTLAKTTPGSGASAGTVTMLTAPASGTTLRIERVVSLLQSTSFRTQGSFSPLLHENALDKLMMAAQQLDADIDEVADDLADEVEELEEDVESLRAELESRLVGFNATDVRVFATIATLKAASTSGASVAEVRGYYASGDGGGGLFYWDSASSATDDGGMVIAPNAGGTGRWKRLVPGGPVQAEWFGYIEGQSAATVTAAFQSALAFIKTTGGRLEFPPGDFTHNDEVGTNQMSASDWADNVELHFRGTAITYAPAVAPISGNAAIVLEGDNIKITGRLYLDSNSAKDWDADLPSQRNFYAGLCVGGKSWRRLAQSVGQFVSGVLVEGVEIHNFDDPLVVYQAGDVVVRHCTVEDFTSTGIVIDDCSSNIEVCYNTVRYGGDDCFFARHYATNPWSVAGNYIGNVRVHHNTFTDCFAKSFGFGGFVDVDAHDNFCKNTWYASCNVEKDVWSAAGGKRIKIHDNIFVDPARAYLPTHPGATYQAPPADTTACNAFHCYNGGTVYFEDIEFYNNTVFNPDQNGVSIGDAKRVKVSGNRFIAGRTTKNAVNRDSDGSGVRLDNCQQAHVSGNQILSNGSQTFKWAYEVVNDADTERIDIVGNGDEQYLNTLFRGISATCEAEVNYEGSGLVGQVGWAPGAIADGAGVSVNMTVTGASLGDQVQVSYNADLQGVTLTGYVSAAGVVTCRAQNETGGSVSLAGSTLRAKVTKQRVP